MVLRGLTGCHASCAADGKRIADSGGRRQGLFALERKASKPPLCGFYRSAKDTVNIEKPESGYADIEISMPRRSFNGVPCPNIIMDRAMRGAVTKCRNGANLKFDQSVKVSSSLPSDLMANLDDGEVEFDLGFRRFRRKVLAYDVREDLARPLQKRPLFRSAVFHALQSFHRSRQFAHLRIRLDDRDGGLYGPLPLENRGEHVQASFGEGLVAMLGMLASSRFLSVKDQNF